MVKLIRNPVIVIMLFLVMCAISWVIFFPRNSSVVEKGRENEMELNNEQMESVETEVPENKPYIESVPTAQPTEVSSTDNSEAGEVAKPDTGENQVQEPSNAQSRPLNPINNEPNAVPPHEEVHERAEPVINRPAPVSDEDEE